MKNRIIKNRVTTILGLLIWIVTVGLFISDKFGYGEMTIMETVTMLMIGWLFFMSKNSLLKGITLGLFK